MGKDQAWQSYRPCAAWPEGQGKKLPLQSAAMVGILVYEDSFWEHMWFKENIVLVSYKLVTL